MKKKGGVGSLNTTIKRVRMHMSFYRVYPPPTIFNPMFVYIKGGGKRCKVAGCIRSARDRFFCAAHGGGENILADLYIYISLKYHVNIFFFFFRLFSKGKRCTVAGCEKSAVGSTPHCTTHGGGRRCQHENCTKSAQSTTKFCVRHGGRFSC
jgi:hypothetical protein